MEDILASIRRIIADDQSRQSSAAPAPPSRAPAMLPLRPSPLPPAAGPLAESLRKEPPLALRPSRPTAPAVPVSPNTGVLPHLNPPSLTPQPATEDLVIREIAGAGVAAARQSAAPEASLAAPDTSALAAPVPVSSEPVAPEPVPGGTAKAYASSPASVEADDGAAVAIPAAAEPRSAADPLVSAEAGATIETSFSALSTSVFLQNAGLVESLVRDMLRPMLKGWLDDNLPSIVERLVRVEIERVARGSKA